MVGESKSRIDLEERIRLLVPKVMRGGPYVIRTAIQSVYGEMSNE